MKRLTTFLLALMLTWIGANAQNASDVVHSCVAEGTDWQKPTEWTATNDATTNFHINTHSTEADPSGMATPFVEYWYGAGTNLPDDVLSHDQLSNLKAGYYTVSIEVRAFNESGTTAITSGTTFNANSASVDITDAGLTSSTAYSNHYELYGTLNLLVQLAETDASTLDINFTVKDANYNWLAFKNLTVTYLGEDPKLSYVNGDMNSTVEQAMKDAVDAWNDSLTDSDLFDAAEAAIQAAEESVAQYATIAAVVENLDATGAAVWASSASGIAYTAKTLATSDDYSTDLAVAQAAQTTPNSDMSYVLTTGTWAADQGNGPAAYQSFAQETYIGTGEATSGKVLYCTVDGLQQGTYTVSFYAAANMANGVSGDSGSNISVAYANNATSTTGITVGTNSAAQITSLEDMTLYTVSGCKVIDGSLQFGIENVADGGNWFLCAPGTLTLVSLGADVEEGEEVHSCTAELSHWTQTYTGSGSNGTYAYNDWSTEADASGMVTPFLQTWVYQALLSDQTIDHEQLTRLPQGWYSVTVDARIMSEAGGTISGTATLTANKDFIYLISDGSDGTYGTESEEYGTYTVECYVDDTGTLDIGFTIANANFNWLAWKNLSVVYLGETVEYNVGEATASETIVSPGQTVTLTFADCIKGDEDATLGVSSTANVTFGSTTVTLTPKGTITFTFDVPEDVESGEYTLTIPANTIVWTLNDETQAGNAAQTITFTVLVPATIEDGEYLIVNAEGNYLGGGLTWGTQAAIIGKPQFIGFEQQDNGTYHLDSHQYNSATAHYLGSNLYFDSSAADWTLMEVEGGFAIYGTADEGTGFLTSNGFQTVPTIESTPYAWTLVTMEDVVASMADATEDAPVDVTALIAAPELKRNCNTTYYPTWTVSTGSVTFGQNSNIGSATANCAETWHSNGGFDVNQTITLPLAGTYTLSAQGFHDGSATDIVLYADDDTADFPYATGVADQAAAYQAFLAGTYPVGAITITTTSDEQEVTIGFKGDNSSEWVVMGELDLQYLGVVEETIEWEMTSAGWGTLILPFAVDDEEVLSGLTLYAGDALTLDTDGTTRTVGTASETIAANTPYLVSGTEGTYTFTGVATNTQDSYQVGMLVGTLVDLSQDAGLSSDGTEYVLQNHEDEDGLAFYPITSESEGVTLDAYHCYLDLSLVTTSARPVALHFPGAGGETGIVAVESELIANDAIYDLSGRKVSKAVKGVYIMNGKKVLVK